jgi:CRP-like cAMP-binding protein
MDFASPDMQKYPYKLFGHGNYLGEWELTFPHARVACARAESETVELLVLSRQHFTLLCHAFPQLLENMRTVARRREARRRQFFRNHTEEFDTQTVRISHGGISYADSEDNMQVISTSNRKENHDITNFCISMMNLT